MVRGLFNFFTKLTIFLKKKVSCEVYAYATHRFLSAGPEGGMPVDFRKSDLVGLGHSLGANAMYVNGRLNE